MSHRILFVSLSIWLGACSTTPEKNYDAERLQRQFANIGYIREIYSAREEFFPEELKGIRLDVPKPAQKLAEKFVRDIGSKINNRSKITLTLTYKTMTRTDAAMQLYAAGYAPHDAANATWVESRKWGRAVVVESKLIEEKGDIAMIGIGAAGYLTSSPKDQVCGGFTHYCANVLYGAIASAAQEAMRSMK